MKKHLSFPAWESLPLKKKLFGDKQFYRMVLGIVIPMILQNGISNFVTMLDNIMVGAIGTEPMSGVSIVTQLGNIFLFSVFGAVGGVGIFTAQYYGKGDLKGVQKTFRFKIWMTGLLTLATMIIYTIYNEDLISLYLHESSDAGDLKLAFDSALGYMKIFIWSFPGLFMVNVYASTLRECGETKVPMIASTVAVFVNLSFNYLLIYGKFGFPEMGVRGAAIATVLSRYVEFGIIAFWTHRHTDKQPWISGIYKTLLVPQEDASNFFQKGLPLLVNEIMWSIAQALLVQLYSTRGLNTIAALNIGQTMYNCVNILFFTTGTAVSIVVGHTLGSGDLEKAKELDTKMITFAVLSACVASALLVAASFFFPNFYNVTPEVKSLASKYILAYALLSPPFAYLQATYFTLRSGGKMLWTIMFDSGSVWMVSLPIAFIIGRFTNISSIPMFLLVNAGDIWKVLLGTIFLRRNMWIQNIVGTNEKEGDAETAQ